METINISGELAKFHEHLKRNPRTILSAKFGDGKTFFLNEYFAKHQIWKDYTPIEERVGSCEDAYFVVLHPVNYSVAKNEDIFEYIKRDILIQLYQEGKIDDIDYKAVFKAIKEEVKEKALPMLGDLVSLIPGGEIAKAIIQLGVDIKKRYDDEKHTAADFLDTFVKQKGGIYEDDAYTQMIRKTLEHLKEPHEGLSARKVLVIEDLDRLDPGHLFRILNVLGAHIDDNKETNKFGFDNIVLVLDYEVTRTIFYHFYGENANYEGYMSKYMTCYPFDYSIKQLALDNLISYLSEECGLGEHLNVEIHPFLDDKDAPNALLSSIITKLSVRDIAQILDNIEDQYRDETVTMNKSMFNSVVPFVKLLSVLTRLQVTVDYPHLARYFSRDAENVKIVGAFVLAENRIEQMRFKIGEQRYMFCVSHRTNGMIDDVTLEPANDDYLSAQFGCKLNNLYDVILKAILNAREYVWDAPQFEYDKY